MRRCGARAAVVGLAVLVGAAVRPGDQRHARSVPADPPSVPVTVSFEDERQRLEQARHAWTESGTDSYRLVVAERVNFWSAGCVWTSEVVAGTVVDRSVESTQSDRAGCWPIDWTVEMLHDHVDEWIELARGQTPDREPNLDTLRVTYDAHGVPIAAVFDVALVVDEEIDRIVTFTPTQPGPTDLAERSSPPSR